MGVIVNITGNIISGQVMWETSKLLSERFGKIMQDRQSVFVNRTDTSISHLKQLDSAIPASKIDLYFTRDKLVNFHHQRIGILV